MNHYYDEVCLRSKYVEAVCTAQERAQKAQWEFEAVARSREGANARRTPEKLQAQSRVNYEASRNSSMNRKAQCEAISLPPLRNLVLLPRDAFVLVAQFARHAHEYRKVYPSGLRDNGEYSMVCCTCGDGK